MGLSNEELCILVTQGATKVPEVKVGGTEKNAGLETWPHMSGENHETQKS